MNAKDEDGNTALMLAAYRGHSEVVRCLIQNESAEHKIKSLMIAASKGKLEVVQVLIGNIGLNAIDEEGKTALMYAASEHRLDVVKFLIGTEADVNAADKKGNTALMCAASKGYLKVVKFLIESKADVNAMNESEYTALTLALPNYHFDVAKMLVENGADMDKGYKFEASLLRDVLLRRKYYQTIEYFIRNGASWKRVHHTIRAEIFKNLSRDFQWNLTDLEKEYEIVSMEPDECKKEQQLNRLWIKVESWIFLGANVREVIHEFNEELSKSFPQINCVDGFFESFLFNYFEFFQSNVLQDLSNEAELMHLSVQDIESLFKIQFGGMRNEEFESVNEFLFSIQNVIRFADCVGGEDLLNKIAYLIVSFDLSDFDSFWFDLKMIFEETDEHNESANPHFVRMFSKLFLAAINKESGPWMENIALKLYNDNVDFDVDAFLTENDVIQVIRDFILDQKKK